VTGPHLILEGVAGHVVLARAFAASALHVLEMEQGAIESVRLAVSELVTALVADGADHVRLAIGPSDLGTILTVGGSDGLPELAGQARAVVEHMLGSPLQHMDGTWVIPLPAGVE
jgi:hypothetical protein